MLDLGCRGSRSSGDVVVGTAARIGPGTLGRADGRSGEIIDCSAS